MNQFKKIMRGSFNLFHQTSGYSEAKLESLSFCLIGFPIGMPFLYLTSLFKIGCSETSVLYEFDLFLIGSIPWTWNGPCWFMACCWYCCLCWWYSCIWWFSLWTLAIITFSCPWKRGPYPKWAVFLCVCWGACWNLWALILCYSSTFFLLKSCFIASCLSSFSLVSSSSYCLICWSIFGCDGTMTGC